VVNKPEKVGVSLGIFDEELIYMDYEIARIERGILD